MHDSSRSTARSTPRWVKVFAIVLAILIVLVVARLLLGGGHGPGRHSPSNGKTPASPPSQQAPSHVPPPGGHQ